MKKSIYYIECTCIKDCSYPNIDFHVGDVFYYNKKASSNEMYLYYSYKFPGITLFPVFTIAFPIAPIHPSFSSKDFASK